MSIIIPAGLGSDPRTGDRELVPLSREAAMRLSAASDVLQELGLQLVCPRCTARYGAGRDGVRGDNEPGASVLEISCNCTVRRYAQGSGGTRH